MNNVTRIVHGVLAQHAGLAPSAVRAWHHLERELDVTPLELAMLSLEIEDAVGVELHAEELVPLETVDDLCVYVARAVTEERRHQVMAKVA